MRFISSGILILTLLVSCAQKQDKIQEDSIDFQLDKVIKTYPDDKVQAFEWSEKLVNKYNNAKISSEIAMIHYRKGNYELATYYFKKSSEQFKADGKILQSAEQLTNLGVVYEILGLYPDAVSVYFKALQIFKEKNKLVSVAKIYNNLGIVYQELDKPKESLSYYNKALQLIEKQGNTLQIASKYNNIGVVYEENLKDYDQAFEYYKKANKIYENEKDINNQIITENNIANIFLLKNKAIEAEVIISHILRLNRKKGNDNYLNKIYLNLSKAYFQENKIEKALETGMKSLQLSRDFSDKQTEVNILKLLSEIYEAKNNYKQANQLLKNYYSLKIR
jgi:tetratricopeptide (TPR) repeat protein